MRRRFQKSGCNSKGQVPRPESPRQAVQTHHMVEVAVAEHDRLERVRGDREPIKVADQAVRRHSGVEEHPSATVTRSDLDQCGEPVLGPQEIERLSAFCHLGRDHRNRPGATERTPAPDQALIGHQDVRGIVDQRGHVNPDDRY